MEINTIKNDDELRAMVARVNAFLEAHADELDNLNPEDAEELELMSLVIGAYEVLNGKRKLTLAMIKKLRVVLGCPADALIGA